MSTTLIDPPSPLINDRAKIHSFLKDLRLLIVADSSTTHTLRWAQYFRDRGVDLTILTHAAEQIPGVRVIQFPQKHWYHRIPKLRMLLDYSPFQKLIRQLDPQLIHIHFVSEGGRAFYWDRINVPIVATTWGQDVIFDNGPYPGAEFSLRKMLAKARIVTATTHMLARETARYMPATKPICITPFGVDLSRFTLRDEKPNDIITLGFVKWLLPKYGPDILIEAFAAIHRERPSTKLLMAGRGDMRDQLEKRIKQLNLTDSVQILGPVPHAKVPDLIRSFDIMLMPSIYQSETFGVAAIEASASAVPVIASKVGGVPEAVLHNQTGLLVPPRDPAALAQATLSLIDDAPRRRQMGLAGRKFVERYYDWNQNTAMMEEIYRAALEEDSPRNIPVFASYRPPDLHI
jgi:glycosyltransferase involved in cell wall biosynthesis